MKKIFKILSILVMVFVLFSCANSASDDSNPTSEPSKHSIIFKHNLGSDWAGYLLFDEVTAALDPEMVHEVLQTMLELAQSGKTMLIVTHEMSFARAIADRILFLDEGELIEEAPPEEFFTSPKTDRAKKFLQTFEYSKK